MTVIVNYYTDFFAFNTFAGIDREYLIYYIFGHNR